MRNNGGGAVRVRPGERLCRSILAWSIRHDKLEQEGWVQYEYKMLVRFSMSSSSSFSSIVSHHFCHSQCAFCSWRPIEYRIRTIRWDRLLQDGKEVEWLWDDRKMKVHLCFTGASSLRASRQSLASDGGSGCEAPPTGPAPYNLIDTTPVSFRPQSQYATAGYGRQFWSIRMWDIE